MKIIEVVATIGYAMFDNQIMDKTMINTNTLHCKIIKCTGILNSAIYTNGI